jgi:Undecaprenyl-phosphate glucose phosphotransferase
MSTVSSSPNQSQRFESSGSARVAGVERLNHVLYRIVSFEFGATFVAALVAMGVYYQVVLKAYIPGLYVTSAVIIAAFVVGISAGFHHYVRIQARRKRWYVSVGVGATGLAFSLFLTFLFLIKAADEYSRGAFIFQLLAVGATVIAVRATAHDQLRRAIRHNKVEARRVVLIGRSAHCTSVMPALIKSGLRIQAILPLPTDETAVSSREELREIVRGCRPLCPDDILLLATEADLRRVDQLREALSELPASLHMMPMGLENILATSKFTELGLVPTIQLLQQPLSLFDRFLKRTLDLCASAVGLVLLCPLFVLVAAVIRLESKGPAIFRQGRHGFNNEVIRVFKFRTMRVVEDGEQFRQATKNDTRITAFGRVLRKTNLDELPQLVNVFLGQMSLVGPRPHPVALNMQFEDQLVPLFRRHNVKPGITGWAQVNGYRGETDTLEKMQMRLRHDLYYIDHWSFLLDLQIILMTLISKKAYSNAG